MRLVAISLALAAAVLPAAAQDGPATLTPEQVGQIFCLSMLGNDMAPTEALLTPDLTQAIAAAEAEDAAWSADNPGEKPPLGDGIPWQAAPDYAAGCTVGAVNYMMDEASVAITHSFPDYPEADFTDRLKLMLLENPAMGWKVWRIDNVSYAGGGDLRLVLKSAFMD